DYRMPDTTPAAPLPFGGVTPVLRVRDVAASRDYYVQALGFKVNFETEDLCRCRADAAVCSCARATRGIQARGCGSMQAMSTSFIGNIRAREQRFATRRRTTRARRRCRWKTWTATSYAWGRSDRPATRT